MELDERKILNCISRGLDVIQANLNKGLGAFGTQAFDCVILSQTLQAVFDVEGVLLEMLRLSAAIASSAFPISDIGPLRCMLAKAGAGA